MRATENLVREHDIIESVIACLTRATDRAAAGEVSGDAYRSCIEFFRDFADRRHHIKEEENLFPRLEKRGVPNAGGPIGCMLEEHDEGRRCLAGMEKSLADAENGDAGATQRLVEHARGYAALLTDHIAKENQVLFPLADEVLDPAQLQELAATFDSLDGQFERDGSTQRLLDLARELCLEWQVEFPSAAT